MDSEIISDDEILYRAVTGNQQRLLSRGGPAAGLFIDAQGLSVDRDGGRSDSEILDAFSARFKKQGCSMAVKIGADECRFAGTHPLAIGNRRNVYHAEIHESESIVTISLLKAMKLASLCRIVS